MTKTIVTQIDVLRHGQCEGGDIFRGDTDVLLTQEGEANMQDKCVSINENWDVVISSPLKRCANFASKWSGINSKPMILNNALREMSFGAWDGQSISKIWQEDADAIQAWSDAPDQHTPPGGEPLIEVASRVNCMVKELLSLYPGKKILLVTHGGVIRVLLSGCLGMPLNFANRWQVPYACVSRLTHTSFGTNNRWQLVTHNAQPDRSLS